MAFDDQFKPKASETDAKDETTSSIASTINALYHRRKASEIRDIAKLVRDRIKGLFNSIHDKEEKVHPIKWVKTFYRQRGLSYKFYPFIFLLS